MKRLIAGLALLSLASPVAAGQFGGLDQALKKAQEQKQKYDDLTFTDDEEREIGGTVSERLRARFGVAQDPAVHRYVTLVGTLLTQASSRAKLPWTFIVLDTDGVNAFASPGGFIHITRGALGLIGNEAELAGVLAHEVAHVTSRHTINAIRKNRLVALGAKEAMKNRSQVLEQVANGVYEQVLENSFDRGDEREADEVAVALSRKAGYAPGALADFLARLAERNKDQAERNGLFASHPETTERVAKVRQLGGAARTPLVDARYKATVKFQPVAITSIATVTDGAAGLTGSSSGSRGQSEKNGGTSGEKPEETAKPESRPRGFGLSGLKKGVAQEKPSGQVAASGGARGVGPDRAAKGGSNPSIVAVTVSASEIEAFRKGVA